MRRLLILLCSFLLFPGISGAQKHGAVLIDSLKTEISSAGQDTIRVKLLTRLSFEYFGFDPDSGIIVGEKALALSQKLGWNPGIAMAYNSLGANWAIKSNYPRAFDWYMKSLSKFTELDDKPRIANALNNIGWLYIFQKDYNKAFEALDRSVKINTELNNEKGLANNYANLGICYNKQGNYPKANEYYYKVLKVHQQGNNKTSVAIDFSNISKNKMMMGQYCEAFEDGAEGLKISEEIDNLYGQALLNRIIGEIYFRVANDKEGYNGDCRNFRNGKHQLLLSAKQHLSKAFTLFKKIDDLSSVSETSHLLYQVFEQLNDANNALIFYQYYSEAKDSIFSRDNSIKIVNIEKNREIDLRDKQLLIQKLEIKNNIQILHLFIAITFVIVLVSVLFILLYASKRRTNRQLEEKNRLIAEMNASKDKFFSIISHDLRGPFNSFLGLTQILEDELPEMPMVEIQKITTSLKRSALNLFRLLENLLHWSRMQRGLVPFEPENIRLFPVVEEVLSLIVEQAAKKGVDITNRIPVGIQVFCDMNMLLALIRNLVSNAVKYTPSGGSVDLWAYIATDGCTELTVRDSGIGMDQKMVDNLFRLDVKDNRKGTDGEPSTGLGLIICQEILEKHHGKLWVESEPGKGSTFHVTLPGNA